MTSEEKQLLLKDLCARLPYGIKVKYFDMEYPFGSEPVILTPYLLYNRWENIQDVKSYLRSMSSMTEEERLELSRLTDDKFKFYLYTTKPEIICYEKYNYLKGLKVLDWLNAHHFDYRIDPSTGKTLIESNLAIEAPKDMYKTE